MDMDLGSGEPRPRDEEEELVSELRSSFLFLMCIMAILLLSSIVGLALS